MLPSVSSKLIFTSPLGVVNVSATMPPVRLISTLTVPVNVKLGTPTKAAVPSPVNA